MGVRFAFGEAIGRVEVGNSRVAGVTVGRRLVKADAHVMALGAYSTPMLSGVLDIPVYPVKGYSTRCRRGCRRRRGCSRRTSQRAPRSLSIFCRTPVHRVRAQAQATEGTTAHPPPQQSRTRPQAVLTPKPLWTRRGAQRRADQEARLSEAQRAEFERFPARREHRRLPLRADRRAGDADSGVAFCWLLILATQNK